MNLWSTSAYCSLVEKMINIAICCRGYFKVFKPSTANYIWQQCLTTKNLILPVQSAFVILHLKLSTQAVHFWSGTKSTFGHDEPHWITTDGNSCHCAAESEGAWANVSVEWENYSLPWGRGVVAMMVPQDQKRGNVHISVTVFSCWMIAWNSAVHIHVQIHRSSIFSPG